MIKDNDFSKIDISKFIKDTEVSWTNYPKLMQNIDFEKTMAPVYQANREKVEREKAMVSTLEKLVSLMEDKPEVINQINTLIQNSNIQNMQNNYGHSVGYQNITSNTGLSPGEYSQLIADMKELFEILTEERSSESKEILEQLDSELNRPEPRKGIIKASLTFLQSMVKEVLTDPAKTVAKEQFIEFAKAKVPVIQEGINHIFTFFSS
ncbi:hypothetical protein ACPUYX_08400 [Desulfosporosinus sp. SYSU MS00001]|uniref:hypothetical protein n=1 Tax=Desulfosporosinus sp. SYSU MS00001 TaxID=3416284 RepID=UPI003CF186F5